MLDLIGVRGYNLSVSATRQRRGACRALYGDLFNSLGAACLGQVSPEWLMILVIRLLPCAGLIYALYSHFQNVHVVTV